MVLAISAFKQLLKSIGHGLRNMVVHHKTTNSQALKSTKQDRRCNSQQLKKQRKNLVQQVAENKKTEQRYPRCPANTNGC